MAAGGIINGQVLDNSGVFSAHALRFGDGVITDFKNKGAFELDATGLMVLPGIVDVHGDAFERQLMPRPGVRFPIEVALLETDRQLAANGITTAFHAVTWSWETGLRDRSIAEEMSRALRAPGAGLSVDTRFHLRHECHNLAAENEIIAWLNDGLIDVLSFNDHVEDCHADAGKPAKVQQYLDRSGLTRAAWDELLARVTSQGPLVPASIERLAAAARKAGVVMMSHDDISPAHRDSFHALGIHVSEFPETEETARRALEHNGAVVFGAPNVVRGRSHTTAPNATDMIAKGLCTVLASDYYYPALALAPFKLVERLGGDIGRYWPLVSTQAARALGLNDRGTLTVGQRADITLIDAHGRVPRVIATLVAGKIVYLADGARLKAA